jgi:hypothetical protein
MRVYAEEKLFVTSTRPPGRECSRGPRTTETLRSRAATWIAEQRRRDEQGKLFAANPHFLVSAVRA